MPPKTKKQVTPVAGSMAALRAQMEKTYGDAKVVRRETVQPYEIISTGSIALDYAMRVGGWVQGRCHQIVGNEGVGKTTLLINSMVQAQKKYPHLAVGYIDMEQTFDYDWAEAQGLNTDDDHWLHLYPDHSEDVSDMIRKQCKTDLFSLLAIDSIGGMESKVAFEKDAEEVTMGKNAQVITRMVKQVAVDAKRHDVAVIFVNQYRANLSGMGSDIAAGPKALKYATTMDVAMRRTGEPTIKIGKGDDEHDIGRQISARVTRSKVAPQGRNSTFWIINEETEIYGPVGIDQADEAYALVNVVDGVPGLCERGTGSWWRLNGSEKNTHNGKEAVKGAFRADPGLMIRIKEAALAMVADEVQPEVDVDFDLETGEILS